MIKHTSLMIALAIGLLASSASAENLNCVRATKAQSAEEAIALI